MIEIAQGSPGSGKSAVAVARAILHLKRGGVVAANFSLVDGWAEDVVKNMLVYRLLWLLSPFFPTLAADYMLMLRPLHLLLLLLNSWHFTISNHQKKPQLKKLIKKQLL